MIDFNSSELAVLSVLNERARQVDSLHRRVGRRSWIRSTIAACLTRLALSFDRDIVGTVESGHLRPTGH